MHELAITQSILNIVLRHPEQAGAQRVTDIHIVMGELSTNVDDSIQFYWDIIARETPAEGAEHRVEVVRKEIEILEEPEHRQVEREAQAENRPAAQARVRPVEEDAEARQIGVARDDRGIRR